MERKKEMTQISASLLIAELKAMGPVIEPVRDGMRLTGIGISEKEGRPIAVFTYDTGRKAVIGVGDGDCGIAAFVKDSVVVAFARMSAFAAKDIGIDVTSRQAMADAGVQVVTSIERMRPADIARCVGPVVDMVELDRAPRCQDLIPSLTSDELAIARAATWTPETRYRQAAEAANARRFAAAKEQTESRRNGSYVPAWGVGAASADTAPTPRGRAPLGRAGRR
jgi:hypothetical protein